MLILPYNFFRKVPKYNGHLKIVKTLILRIAKSNGQLIKLDIFAIFSQIINQVRYVMFHT